MWVTLTRKRFNAVATNGCYCEVGTLIRITHRIICEKWVYRTYYCVIQYDCSLKIVIYSVVSGGAGTDMRSIHQDVIVKWTKNMVVEISQRVVWYLVVQKITKLMVNHYFHSPFKTFIILIYYIALICDKDK